MNNKEYLKHSGKETENEAIRLIQKDFNQRPLSILYIEDNILKNKNTRKEVQQ